MVDAIETASHNLCPYDIDCNHYIPILISDITRGGTLFGTFGTNSYWKVETIKLMEVFPKELASRERYQFIKPSKPSPQIIDSQG